MNNAEFPILALTILGAISILLYIKAEPSLVTLIQAIGVVSVLMLGFLAILFYQKTIEVKQPIIPSVKIETIQTDDKIVSDTTYIYNFKRKQ